VFCGHRVRDADLPGGGHRGDRDYPVQCQNCASDRDLGFVMRDYGAKDQVHLTSSEKAGLSSPRPLPCASKRRPRVYEPVVTLKKQIS